MKNTIKVGINGLGRIGRQIFRLAIKDPQIDIIGVNELNPDIKNWAYTLNYDTIYGKLDTTVTTKENRLIVNGNRINTSHEEDIDKVDWGTWNVDIVIDCTGIQKNVINARKLLERNDAKKVIVTHSPDEVDFTMVMGVNDNKYNHKTDHLISSSICDATAIGPVTKLINDNFRIDSGYVTTLHPWLSYQNLMDGPSSSWAVAGEIFHHYALGRSAIGNMIPKPTSAMDAVFKVIPSLSSKSIGSLSYRTPTQIIGSADITYIVNSKVSKDNLIKLFKCYEENQSNPIIKMSNEPLVSLDYIGEDYSAIIDTRWLDVIGENLIKVVLWYDNEYGYSCKVMCQVKHIASFFNSI
ncbi:type I glyceraldehyde-3-phosphate dehydrogenase [Prochlorococcus marinus]|uniref:Glyceraldehyde-3-phosphate dehydrogenase/erythrose-4-phosphate dehydrogenase n=1 Tax=Prochlorococcus marinus (strain MIT 9211) TaxID=93059 RepID=A9BBK5_PROM4|nr:glyceraldehyde 3-phosphate dehydrogenase NAD-binding domain-containing protein [Prochlorococcus marinus]ABX09217.1 Glyceraldehyde-3-phosphate dehydrogenase/erythrose-4-phosphate dehydrogenase [Prochlorococcus marinus str. MIT 9211]